MSPKVMVMATMVWACACKTVDPYVATGETLHTVAREFVETGHRLTEACNDHTLGKDQCDHWGEFATKFKASYALAVKTWRFAVDNQDAIKKGQATDLILSLSAELAEFTSLGLQLLDHPPAVTVQPTGGDL